MRWCLHSSEHASRLCTCCSLVGQPAHTVIKSFEKYSSQSTQELLGSCSVYRENRTCPSSVLEEKSQPLYSLKHCTSAQHSQCVCVQHVSHQQCIGRGPCSCACQL